MKMVSRTATSTITCQIEVAKDCRVHICTACKLLSESVAYAVCRFIKTTPSLRHSLVHKSYQLRLSKAKDRRMQRHSFVAPAALMELSGGWVEVRLTVSPVGISISSIRLSEDYPTVNKPLK